MPPRKPSSAAPTAAGTRPSTSDAKVRRLGGDLARHVQRPPPCRNNSHAASSSLQSEQPVLLRFFCRVQYPALVGRGTAGERDPVAKSKTLGRESLKTKRTPVHVILGTAREMRPVVFRAKTLIGYTAGRRRDLSSTSVADGKRGGNRIRPNVTD